MTFEPRIGPNGREDDLTRALRRLYAAPADDAYWAALAQRIMARIAGESEAWWQPLAGWARAGIIAAGIALAVASIALTRSRNAEAGLLYRAIMETSQSPLLQIATEPGATSAGRDVTLRYVISP